MWRAGFGPAADQLDQLKKISPQELYKALRKASSKPPEFIDVADSYLKGLVMGIDNEAKLSAKNLDQEEKKKLRQKQKDSIKNLNLAWLDQIVNSKAQLREKTALFWHGHFASRNLNVFYQQQMLQVIREHALGSFRTLIHDVSKSAAMLFFLNAAQNKKGHPNENFAREVMELFTLGRGNYTEQDVKEAARAFTGWSANLQGEFVFRKFQHDEGAKTLFGKSGNYSGEDVLDILLDQKQTARFITQKIYRYFVNERADSSKTEWLAERFYASDYNIGELLDDIFMSDWFYYEKNIGAKIKSPVELLAGMQRMLPMELENNETLLLLQRVLGQMLFYPPNVAGWPGGKAWIDSSTLMLRLRLPGLLTALDEFNIRPKTDDDQMMGREANDPKDGEQKLPGKLGRPLNANLDWERYLRHFKEIPREQLLTTISETLFQVTTAADARLLKNHIDSSSRENMIKTATIQLMSTPEYQMC